MPGQMEGGKKFQRGRISRADGTKLLGLRGLGGDENSVTLTEQRSGGLVYG